MKYETRIYAREFKRFLLFVSSDDVTCSGGWNDFAGDYDTIDEASDAAERDGFDGYHVVDLTTDNIVREVNW